MKRNRHNRSIILNMLASTFLIFAAMLVSSSYMIGRKQAELTQRLEQQVEEQLLADFDRFQNGGQLTLIIDETRVRALTEYRLYAVMVIGVSLLIGGLLIYWSIMRQLKPFAHLTGRIEEIDVEKLPLAHVPVLQEEGSYEVYQLSLAFQTVLDKLIDGYNRQKRFSVNVAHELRTPLAILLTKIDLYKRQNHAMSAETADFIAGLEDSIGRLSKLVEDILLLSKDYAIEKHPVSVRTIAEEVVLDLEDRARAKNISLTVAGNDFILDADDSLLARILFNLTENAIKYTPAGGFCKIVLQVEGQTGVLSVLDNGIGMSDAQKQAAFDLFYRADDSRSQKIEGYGIGLALVKDMVLHMNGTVSITDNRPQGSIFTIRFPLSEK
ncbi:MAG: sensor histidine kinase [Bulleidia sp.]